MLDTAPDIGAIFGAALGDRQRVDYVQYPLQGTIEVAAAGALFQVLFRGESIALFAVIMQNQLFFSQMVHLASPTVAHALMRTPRHHRAVLTSGSRDRRSFCTARKTLCLAAPG